MAVARGAWGKHTPWSHGLRCREIKKYEEVTDPRQAGHICDPRDGGALREVRTDVSGSQIRGRLVISVTTAPRGPGRFVLGATSNRKLRLRFDGDLADAQGFGPNLLVQVAPDVSQCGCASGEPPGSYVAYVRMCNSKLDPYEELAGWHLADRLATMPGAGGGS